MMRRRIACALLALVVALAQAGCAPGAAAPTPRQPSADAPAPSGPDSAAPAATVAGGAGDPPAGATFGSAPPAARPPATPVAAPRPTGAASNAVAEITTRTGRRVQVRLEVAGTPESRAAGLSRRRSLPEDAGMLFVFPSDVQAPFWMKDTLMPLSIAFIAADGEIVEIQDMQPLSEELHRPARPYRYALEVNQGFFDRNGVGAGDKVDFRLGGLQ